MKSFIIILVIFYSNIFISVSAQILKKENIDIYTYDLDIELNSSPYNIIQRSSKNLVHFYNYLDESKPGTPVLPSKDIFIAISPGSSPTINVKLIGKKEINAEPELNPIVYKESDSSFVYQEAQTPLISQYNELYKVNGFLWIGNNYCLHLTINQYQYDYQNRLIIENNNILVELKFDPTHYYYG